MNELIPVYLATLTALKEDIRSVVKTWPATSQSPAKRLAEEIHTLVQGEIQHLEMHPSQVSTPLVNLKDRLRHLADQLPERLNLHFSEYTDVIEEIISTYQ